MKQYDWIDPLVLLFYMRHDIIKTMEYGHLHKDLYPQYMDCWLRVYILKNKRGNVVDIIWSAIHILWIDLFLTFTASDLFTNKRIYKRMQGEGT